MNRPTRPPALPARRDPAAYTRLRQLVPEDVAHAMLLLLLKGWSVRRVMAEAGVGRKLGAARAADVERCLREAGAGMHAAMH